MDLFNTSQQPQSPNLTQLLYHSNRATWSIAYRTRIIPILLLLSGLWVPKPTSVWVALDTRPWDGCHAYNLPGTAPRSSRFMDYIRSVHRLR